MIRRSDFFLFLFMMQHHAMYVCCVGSTPMIIPVYFGKARARWMCRVFRDSLNGTAGGKCRCKYLDWRVN